MKQRLQRLQRLQLLTDTLDERLCILSMRCSTPADQSYYDGMIRAAYILGYDVLVDNDGNHKLIER